ncbi:protein NLP6-like [Silene latifolia]|uniref:protein NLP6-like n=1 Tax=Silene latifolia TaxID=37657 RepID=UPI003D76B04C
MGFNPLENMDVSYVIKEKMSQALRYFKESTEHHQILAQVWAPVRNGNRYVLTTSGQPFVIGPHSHGLNQYRTVSLKYMFSVDGENDSTLGLPGRVFRHRLPEWTPNVQYYSSEEYSRVNHAKDYDVKGTLALPVFESSGQSCVGVIELIMTSQKINYAPEVDKVCKALEAVNLRSSGILDHPNNQICNESRQNALAEILEVLTEVCETHKLPLAQTWIPCRHRSILAYGGGLKKSCSSFDGSCMKEVCMSTTDVAFYIVDARMWGFREACAEHHLQKGQGAVGNAFSSQGLSFCTDISNLCKLDYPLVHYARMFGLRGSFAICLRSQHTGDDDYVLQFFLPSNITDTAEQLNLVDSILATMKPELQSLMVASGYSLEEERKRIQIIQVSSDDNQVLRIDPNFSINSLFMLQTTNSLIPFKTDFFDVAKNLDDSNGSNDAIFSGSHKETTKTSKKKRGKAEKQIGLDVLQQYFSGSLKDAAKCLGVCPTTMKRICRQHGISRWPSRKINKVNRSLTKLKHVMESVEGRDGSFNMSYMTQPTIIPASEEARLNGPNNSRTSSDENGGVFKTGSGSGEFSTVASTSRGSSHGSPTTDEDAGTSKDLRNLCPSPVDANLDDPSCPSSSLRVSRFGVRQDMKSVTIKAIFKQDIIRFRFSRACNMSELKDEVGKRLKLEVGTFEIKYQDDNHDWVLISCESDLEECLDKSKSGGSDIIRLLVEDQSYKLGSSCESSG